MRMTHKFPCHRTLSALIVLPSFAAPWVDLVGRDLSTPALAQSLLDVIGPAISILASVGGNLVQTLPNDTGVMMLSDFLRDVLRIDGGRCNGGQREVLRGAPHGPRLR